MIKCNGQCAKCLSMNIDYDSISIRGEKVCYPYTCNDCGHEGKEYYSLEYTESK